MGGEPWRFTPAEIGKLTDRQIWDQYVRPHVERYREARRGRKPRGRSEPNRLPTREEFVEMGTETFNLPREHLEREYDEWRKSPEAKAALAKEKARKRKA